MLEWIDPAFAAPAVATTAAVVLYLVGVIVRATPDRMQRVRAKVEATPGGRIRHYGIRILSWWALGALALVPLLFTGVSPADLGLGAIDAVHIATAVFVFVLGLALRMIRVRIMLNFRRSGRPC